jgi:hypothetical protein
VTKDPKNVGLQLELATSYASIGDLLREQGKLDEAVAAFREGEAIAQTSVDQEPNNLGARQRLWFSSMNVGNALKSRAGSTRRSPPTARRAIS